MQDSNVDVIYLSKRLYTVANMVSKGCIVADIGCDHGFVSIYLIESKTSPRVIAMDINDGPLLRAKEHISNKNLTEYIDIRKSDGAKALRWIDQSKKILEVNSLIAAGIGGRLVIKIMKESLDKIRTLNELILQPQSEVFLVRKFLEDNNFVIINEDMVLDDGKYYPVIKVVPSIHEKMNLNEYERYYGPLLIKNRNSTLEYYLIREREKYTALLKNLQKDNKDNTVTSSVDFAFIENKITRITHTLAIMARG